jgi:hypothetical protein
MFHRKPIVVTIMDVTATANVDAMANEGGTM